MSDYISKSTLIEALRNYAEQKHCGGETVLANGILKAVCFIEKEENIPTLDEKEIIRKAFERVLQRLEETKIRYFLSIANTGSEIMDFAYENVGDALDRAIEIVKEECGINE